MCLMAVTASKFADARMQTLLKKGQLQNWAFLDGEDVNHGAFLLKKYEESGGRGSIVVSRTYAHGDVMLAATVLESLKLKFPGKEIIFHTSTLHEPLVRGYLGVKVISGDELLRAELRKAGVFLDLDDIPEKFEEKTSPVEINRIEIFHQYLGLHPEAYCPSYYMTEAETEAHLFFLEQHRKPYIGFSPSSIRMEKSWPLDRWRTLVNALVDGNGNGGTVFIFDGKDAMKVRHPQVVPIINRHIRAAAAVAWHMDVMVTQDSLWTHLAAAMGVPQVLLASCTDGELLSWGYPDTTVIQRDWDCVPCWYDFSKGGCVTGNYPRCLSDVSVEEVRGTVMEVLGNA
jgi:ADP-heptose:LPS heptosyltransferase